MARRILPASSSAASAVRRSPRRPHRQRPLPSMRAPVAERRLVSVLFADLVGFTTVSENRDAEEMRELLSRYFETARTIIDRYGGTVEKFIGDAVMAVWGTPIAREDDAERAVRAGARADCRRDVARRRGRRAWSPRTSRDPHGRGRGHAGGRGPGNGRRRPRQHRIAHPVRRGAGPGARRRSDATRDGGVDRLRGGRRARAQGQGGGGTALARASRAPRAGGRPPRRRASRRRSSAAIASCGS